MFGHQLEKLLLEIKNRVEALEARVFPENNQDDQKQDEPTSNNEV